MIRVVLWFFTIQFAYANEPVSPTILNAPDEEAARRHHNKGVVLFELKRYADAATEFEAAKRLKPSPAFDFNIARCQDRLEQWSAAADSYERYLDGAPNAPEATELRERIKILRFRTPLPVQHIPDPLLSPTPPLSPAQEPERPRRIATWIVGSAGAASLVSALITGVFTHTRYTALIDHCSPEGLCADTPNIQRAIHDGRTTSIATDALLGVGLVAVAAGIVLFFVEPKFTKRKP